MGRTRVDKVWMAVSKCLYHLLFVGISMQCKAVIVLFLLWPGFPAERGVSGVTTRWQRGGLEYVQTKALLGCGACPASPKMGEHMTLCWGHCNEGSTVSSISVASGRVLHSLLVSNHKISPIPLGYRYRYAGQSESRRHESVLGERNNFCQGQARKQTLEGWAKKKKATR